MELPIPDWATWKALCVTTKNLNNQYVETDDNYSIIGPDANNINWIVVLNKKLADGSTNPDATDFETNVKPACNFAVGTRTYPFASSDFLFEGNGVSFTAAANGATASDFKISTAGDPGLYINGGDLFTNGSKVGDYVQVQVVDVDNILGYGAGTVLNEWVSKWYVDPKGGQSVMTPYAGKIPGGLYLRLIYHNTNLATTVAVAVNYHLHKPI